MPPFYRSRALYAKRLARQPFFTSGQREAESG